MKILFIKENNDIEVRSVTVKDNKFTINQHLYLINNPQYYYNKIGIINKLLNGKKLLVYRENIELNYTFDNPEINNQLDKEVRDALYYTKFVSDALGFIKNDISQLLIEFIPGNSLKILLIEYSSILFILKSHSL